MMIILRVVCGNVCRTRW